MTSDEMAYRLGYAVFPLVLLAVAAFVGWRMGKKRQPPKFVAWPVGVAALLLALSMVGMQLTKKADTAPAGEVH